MNFIFPKNYNLKPKLFGFIDYTAGIIDASIGFILYLILSKIKIKFYIKLYIFIGIFLPILLFSIIGINKESFTTVFKYMIKFIRKEKIFLYKK